MGTPTDMTKEELLEAFNEYEPLAAVIGILDDDEAVVETGIAVQLGTNINVVWHAGDFIVFWKSGDLSLLPDEFAFFHLVY